MTAIQRFALHGTIMNPHSSGPYVRHEDHLAAMQGRCLAQIEEPAQPVAEICSASHDDAQFGERAIKPLCDISGFDYGTPLYAGAAPAAVAEPSREEIAALRAEHGITSTGRGIKEFEQVDAFVRAVLQRWGAAPALEAPAAPAPDWLRSLEWAVGGYDRAGDGLSWCPRCGGCQTDYRGGEAGHKDGCELAAALAAAPQAPAQEAPAAHSQEGDVFRALIEFVLSAEEPLLFLHRWNEGSFDICRGGWPEAPEALYPLAAAPQAPNCTRCSGSGEDPVGYLTHGRGPDDHTVDGPCRECDGTGAAPQAPAAPSAFQQRVQPWLLECFGSEIAADRRERNHRFLEEALELVQACGCTASEAHQLVDYVFGRPVGEPAQETGGVMVTLAALCLANSLDMHQAGETELARIWTMVEKIRAKQAAKPKHSPLPAAPAAPAVDSLSQAARDVLAERQRQISAEGYEPEADDMYESGELARAAATYALLATGDEGWRVEDNWPWGMSTLKRAEPRRMLEKAGALILADMERLDRVAAQAAAKGEHGNG